MRTIRILCGWIFLLLPLLPAWGADDIGDIRRQRQELLERISKTDKQLSENQKSVKAQMYRYTLISDRVKESERYLGRLQSEYNRTMAEIRSLNEQYSRLDKQLAAKKEQYSRMVRQMYLRLNDNDKLMFIFSADSFTQSWRRLRYLGEYSRHERRQAEEIKQKQEELAKIKQELEIKRRQQEDLVKEQKKERDRLASERQQQNRILQDLKKRDRALQTELANQKRQADKLDQRIKQIIADENRKSSSGQGKGNSVTYAMTVDEKKLADDFGKNMGKLPLPVTKPGQIVVHFGEQKHKDMKYVQTNSNGIDIQTEPGASAKAIFNGTVTRVFSIQNSNFSIIVRHGNYLSVYSNIEQVNVKSGQKVKIGEPLGTIYVDKSQHNLTVLHFQVWKDLDKMNPELWLSRN